jgi:hypothetical protein
MTLTHYFSLRSRLGMPQRDRAPLVLGALVLLAVVGLVLDLAG